MSALFELSIEEAARKLAAREISSVELTDACLDRIAATDDQVGSFLEVTQDVARAQAAEADKRLADGSDTTPLTGIPIGLKDLFVTAGTRTTCAAKILENFVPRFDSTVTSKLARASAWVTWRGVLKAWAAWVEGMRRRRTLTRAHGVTQARCRRSTLSSVVRFWSCGAWRRSPDRHLLAREGQLFHACMRNVLRRQVLPP